MAVILLYQLVVPPIVGVANNGDFERFMGRLGLQHLTTEYTDKYWNYVNREFSITARNWWRSGYVSSENLFVEVALLLCNLISKTGLFDIRALGLTHALAFLSAIWLMLVASRGFPGPVRCVFGLCLVVVFTDVGYVAFFNSLYSEPAALIFLCLAVGLALLCLVSPKPSAFLPLSYLVAAMLFASSKPQTAWLGIPLAAYGVYLSGTQSSRGWRVILRGAVLVLCLVCVLVFQATPEYLKGHWAYNSIFYGILRNSLSPGQDLRELGLDGGLAPYAGTISYLPDSAINDADVPLSFFARIGWGRILRFYASHPDRLINLAHQSAESAFLLRDPRLGNYEKSAGLPPRAKSQAFDIWSRLRAQLAPKSLWCAVGFLALHLGIAVVCLVLKRDPIPDVPGSAGLIAVLALMSMMAFASSIIGAGLPDIVRHLFVFSVHVDLLLLLDLLAVGQCVHRARNAV